MNYTNQNDMRLINSTVQAELEPGEKLLWSGKSQATVADCFLKNIGAILFAIPWTAFAIFWICGASGFKLPNFSKIGPELFFPLFGLPFVLIGLGMFSSPYWS